MERPTIHCPKCEQPAPVAFDKTAGTIIYQCCNVVEPYPPYLMVEFTKKYRNRDNYHVPFRSADGYSGYISLFVEQGRDVRPIVEKMLGMALTDYTGQMGGIAMERPTIHCPKCKHLRRSRWTRESRTILYECCNIVEGYPPYLDVAFCKMYGSRDNYLVQFRSTDGYSGFINLFVEEGRDARPIAEKMLGMAVTNFIGK